jgi:hypothetical protein
MTLRNAENESVVWQRACKFRRNKLPAFADTFRQVYLRRCHLLPTRLLDLEDSRLHSNFCNKLTSHLL